MAEMILDNETIKSLREIAAGDADFLRDLVEIYARDARKSLNALQVAADSNDLEELGKLAHSLKGSSRYLGAVQVATLAENIEKQAGRKKITEAVTSLTQLAEQLPIAIDGLNNELIPSSA